MRRASGAIGVMVPNRRNTTRAKPFVVEICITAKQAARWRLCLVEGSYMSCWNSLAPSASEQAVFGAFRTHWRAHKAHQPRVRLEYWAVVSIRHQCRGCRQVVLMAEADCYCMALEPQVQIAALGQGMCPLCGRNALALEYDGYPLRSTGPDYLAN